MAQSSLQQLNNLLQLSKTMQEMEEAPAAEIKKKAPTKEILQQLGALGLLKEQLGRVAELKEADPMLGTNTGPFIGRFWDVSSDKDAYGSAKAPGRWKSAKQALMETFFKDASNQRNRLQSAVDAAGQYAFDVGGKTLSAGEAVRTDAPLPNMFHSDEAFKTKLDETLNHWIPLQLKARKKTLSQYYDPEIVKKMLGNAGL